jgi:hypothetical protein
MKNRTWKINIPTSGTVCMSSRSEKFVVEMNVAAEVAKIEKMAERCRDQSLGSVDFLFSDVAKHSFEFLDKVQSMGLKTQCRIDVSS